MITFKLEGLEETVRNLGELPKSTGRSAIVRAARKAMAPVLAAAKSLVPVREGLIKQTLTMSNVRVRRGNPNTVGAVVVWVPFTSSYRTLVNPVAYVRGPNRGQSRTYQIGSDPGVYANFVEFGTSNAPARPFMRPAWDRNKEQALVTFNDELITAVERAAERRARRLARLGA